MSAQRTDESGLARLQVKPGRLHCSFCVATITKALGRPDGVEAVSVSLAHEEGLVRDRGQPPCGYVRQALRDQVAGIDQRIAELVRLRERLLALDEKTQDLPEDADCYCGIMARRALAILGMSVLPLVDDAPVRMGDRRTFPVVHESPAVRPQRWLWGTYCGRRQP